MKRGREEKGREKERKRSTKWSTLKGGKTGGGMSRPGPPPLEIIRLWGVIIITVY